MEFFNLGQNERQLLLEALDFDIEHLYCYYCKNKVDYIKCSIMPPFNNENNATIICDSLLCISSYLEDIENEN